MMNMTVAETETSLGVREMTTVAEKKVGAAEMIHTGTGPVRHGGMTGGGAGRSMMEIAESVIHMVVAETGVHLKRDPEYRWNGKFQLMHAVCQALINAHHRDTLRDYPGPGMMGPYGMRPPPWPMPPPGPPPGMIPG